MLIEPSSIVVRPANANRSVVFPHPLGPTMETTSVFSIENDTLFKTGVFWPLLSPKDLWTLTVERYGGIEMVSRFVDVFIIAGNTSGF
jgi:hypothetical protein